MPATTSPSNGKGKEIDLNFFCCLPGMATTTTTLSYGIEIGIGTRTDTETHTHTPSY